MVGIGHGQEEQTRANLGQDAEKSNSNVIVCGARCMGFPYAQWLYFGIALTRSEFGRTQDGAPGAHT